MGSDVTMTGLSRSVKIDGKRSGPDASAKHDQKNIVVTATRAHMPHARDRVTQEIESAEALMNTWCTMSAVRYR
jgi:hypothetical protein|eukprot:774960-Prymnesium_polylepis.1